MFTNGEMPETTAVNVRINWLRSFRTTPAVETFLSFMRRYATLIALAACSTKTIEHDAAPSNDPAPQLAAPQMGQHGAAIELIAISDDGNAALTQDARGGTRLWPTLDGRAEPVVVPLSFATTLAIGRTESGYVVTACDDSAGLEIVELDAAGRVLARTRVSPDPEVRSVVIDRGRVLVLRADQIIVEYAPSGRVITELPVAAGEHVQELVARAGHVMAIADGHGIWLDRMTWGARTHAITLQKSGPIVAAALAPGGTALALATRDAFLVVDLAAQKTLFEDVGNGPILGIGFTDDTTIVTEHESDFEWRPLDHGERVLSTRHTGNQIAFGHGQVLRGQGRSIEMTTKSAVRYLGYESHTGPEVGGAWKLPPDPRPLTDIQRLDDDHVLVTRGNDGYANGLAVFDTTTGEYGTDLSTVAGSKVQRYESSTGLLVLSDHIASYLVQYDRASHKFDTWYRIEYEASDLHVVDPAIANGAVAIAVRTGIVPPTVRIERFYASDLIVGAPIKSGDVTSYKGTFLGLDKAGRAYIAEDTDVVLYDESREVRRYVGVKHGDTAHVVVGPSVVLVDGDTVALLDDRGIERWRVVAPVTDVRWEGSTLVGIFATGSATFDLATGTLGGRTCGWGFGISTVPRTENIDEDSICEAR